MATSGNTAVSHAGEPGTQFTDLDAAKSDSADIANYQQIRGIYVGVGGNIKVNDWDGNTFTFVGAAAGTTLPIRPRRIFSTLTTATGLIGIR